jgi:hypothetical protein
VLLKRHLTGLAVALGLVACAPTQSVVVQERGCDTSFRVVNNSSGTVERLYFSHASQSGWGNDQLGDQVLPSGKSASYRAANTGAYDFRVVWANGRAAELRRIDICVASTITIHDSGLSAN